MTWHAEHEPAGRPSRARPATARSRPPDHASDSRADNSPVARAIQTAISSGEIVSVGVLNLVRGTIVAVLGGVREIGAEVATAGVAAVRGAIRAAAEIGGDLGMVAKQAVRGSIQAADEIGGDLGASRARPRGARCAPPPRSAATSPPWPAARWRARRTPPARSAPTSPKLARSAADGALEAADGIGGATRRAVRTGVGRVAGASASSSTAARPPTAAPAGGGGTPRPSERHARGGAKRATRAT